MTSLHRRISPPLVTGLRIESATAACELAASETAPARDPDLFPSAPCTLSGRWRATAPSAEITLTVTGDGLPRILVLDPSADAFADEFPVPADVEGPACVLFHEEDDQMADLLQLALHGTVSGGVFRVERRIGSLAPTRPSSLDQLQTLRSLARQARRKRPVFERWTQSPRTCTR